MMYMTKEDRLLPLQTLKNTRELGGYETQEGSYTKTHCFIRAATPAFLNEEDAAYLYEYGVRVICDLRGRVISKFSEGAIFCRFSFRIRRACVGSFFC